MSGTSKEAAHQQIIEWIPWRKVTAMTGVFGRWMVRTESSASTLCLSLLQARPSHRLGTSLWPQLHRRKYPTTAFRMALLTTPCNPAALWMTRTLVSPGYVLLHHWEWTKLHKRQGPMKRNNTRSPKRRQMALMNQTDTDPERLTAGDVNLKITIGSYRFCVTQHIRTRLPKRGMTSEQKLFLGTSCTSVLSQEIPREGCRCSCTLLWTTC